MGRASGGVPQSPETEGQRSKPLHRKRSELVERSFEQVLDDGGMRRMHLRGRENIAKRYLSHTAAFNLGLIMRKLIGFGPPKGWADAHRACSAPVSRVWQALERAWPALCRHLTALGVDGTNQVMRRYAA